MRVVAYRNRSVWFTRQRGNNTQTRVYKPSQASVKRVRAIVWAYTHAPIAHNYSPHDLMLSRNGNWVAFNL